MSVNIQRFTLIYKLTWIQLNRLVRNAIKFKKNTREFSNGFEHLFLRTVLNNNLAVDLKSLYDDYQADTNVLP